MSIPNALVLFGRFACRAKDRVPITRTCCSAQCQKVFIRLISFSSSVGGDHPSSSHHEGGSDRKMRPKFGRLMMSKELYERKMRKIEAQKEEKVPEKFFAKVHYYFKRYWYIALPVHFAVCSVWFGALYFAVKSGMDVVALLERMHMPDHWVDKIRNVPPSAGFAVAALILYKIATPLRYACTLVGIRIAFNTLRRLGKLRTTREIDLTVRQRLDLLIEHRDQKRSAKRAVRHQNNSMKRHSLCSSRTRTKLD
ncbi:hypothetical protein niasHS_006438 [Heterodera schachtii]|uniref:DUF1279 domain-containing protein n=1 Tax=Heterodera schachtii TaxID=97005 RepID=A0ABD2JHB4_HETSC